jgi:hypothetical protein
MAYANDKTGLDRNVLEIFDVDAQGESDTRLAFLGGLG